MATRDSLIQVTDLKKYYNKGVIKALDGVTVDINKEGFIRYSSILAGNTADPNSLPDMVETLNSKTRVPNDPKEKVLVCLDAGIATEENLQKIKEKGYNYLCVSRRRLTDYELAPDAKTVTVLDCKNQPINLTQVRHEEGGDYYLEIKSQAKKLKETSMNRKFKERFEEELKKAKDSLTKKNGTKAYEKVIERVGRARQKYPSISKYYVIDYIPDDANPKKMADIQWRIAVPENVDRDSGVYFLRTNVPTLDEKATWDYYNLTREIECTNRQLKTDLNLRPIHHKKDDRSDAHLEALLVRQALAHHAVHHYACYLLEHLVMVHVNDIAARALLHHHPVAVQHEGVGVGRGVFPPQFIALLVAHPAARRHLVAAAFGVAALWRA